MQTPTAPAAACRRTWPAVGAVILLVWFHIEWLCGGERSGITELLINALIYLEWLLPLGGAGLLGLLLAKIPAADARRAAPVMTALGFAAAALGFTPELWGERAAVLCRAVLLFAGAAAAGIRLAVRLLPTPAAALSAGSGIPAPGSENAAMAAAERLLAGCGFGLGLYALAALLAGTVGRLPAGIPAAAAVYALCGISLFAGGRTAAQTLTQCWRGTAAALTSAGGAGWALWMLLLAGMALLARFCWLPPLDYDVLEYHAALPLAYLRTGAITFIPANMFSGFPQNTEMLTLLTLLTAGENIGGAAPGAASLAAAQWLNFMFLPLTFAALALIFARAVQPFLRNPGAQAAAVTAVLAALLALLAQGGTFQWSAVLYVENGFAFYWLLTVYGVLRTVGAAADNPQSVSRYAAVAGISAGLCAGCKYTGLLFAGAGACGMFLLFVRGMKNKLAAAALGGGLCWALLAPWLLKNYFSTGNPFYPLWNLAFGTANWDAVQEQRFYQAHRPGWAMDAGTAVFTAAEFCRRAVRLLSGIGGESFGALLLAGSGGWLLGRKKNIDAEKSPQTAGQTSAAVILLVWLLFIYLIWFFTTHRVERFFHTGFLLLVLLSAGGLWRLLAYGAGKIRFAAAAAVAGAAGLLLTALCGNFAAFSIGPAAAQTQAGAVLSGETPAETWVRLGYRYSELADFLTAHPQSNVLLVGPADTYYLPAHCTTATVFDQHPFFAALGCAADADALAKDLRSQGFTHIYFHWREWWRFQSTYYQAYSLPLAQQQILSEFLRRHLRLLGVLPGGRQEWKNAFHAANPRIFSAPDAVAAVTFGAL